MAVNLVCRVFSLLFIWLSLRLVCAGEFGVLVAKAGQETENFCIMYYKDFSSLPETITDNYVPLFDGRKRDFCKKQIESTSSNFEDMKNKIILSKPDNCSLADRARNVKAVGGRGMLVVTLPGTEPIENLNGTEDEGINITVALISDNSIARLLDMGQNIRIVMFSPSTLSLDYGLLIIWAVAVFTVVVGSYWSGIIRQSLHNYEMGKLSDPESMLGQSQSTTANKRDSHLEEESTLNVSPILIGIFVLCMGGMLLLLYFFFDYLVYVIITLFVLASMISVYNCLEPLFFKFKCGFCRLPECNFSFMRCSLDFRQLLLLAFAISLSITWVVLRKESYSWILQDILGVAFSINMLKSIRLPSLKICSLLLVLLFFYDIFFVFITPYLTVKGDSVMVEVATGGNSKEQRGKSIMLDVGGEISGEQLPMVLRVPHLRTDPLRICSQPYSLLGFGDILVPGLLVSYCHGIDMFLNNRKIYYISACIAYGVGLVATFIGLYMMSIAQPALLYLVPATLIPTILIGWCRGELSLLWNGVQVAKLQAESTNFDPGSNQTDGNYGSTSGGCSAPPFLTNHSQQAESDTNLVPGVSNQSLPKDRSRSSVSDAISQNGDEKSLL